MIRDLNYIENYNLVKHEDIKTFKINIFTKILETLKKYITSKKSEENFLYSLFTKIIPIKLFNYKVNINDINNFKAEYIDKCLIQLTGSIENNMKMILYYII